MTDLRKAAKGYEDLKLGSKAQLDDDELPERKPLNSDFTRTHTALKAREENIKKNQPEAVKKIEQPQKGLGQ